MLRSTVAALALLLTVVVSSPALAQDGPTLERFSSLRFAPAEGPGNLLNTDTARVYGHLVPTGSVYLDYAHSPLVLFNAKCDDAGENCERTTENTRLVRFTLAANLMGSLAIYDRVQVGLLLPLVFGDGSGFAYTDNGGNLVEVTGGSNFVIGDPRIGVKVRLFGEPGHELAMALKAMLTLPIGQAMADDSFLGEGTVTAGLKLAMGYERERIHVLGNIGFTYRPEQVLFSTSVGSDLPYSIAFAYDFTQLISAGAEIDGSTSFVSDSDENRLEGRIFGKMRHSDFVFTVGAGAGILEGPGIPLFRFLAGASYMPLHGDMDGDGVDDSVDGCPSEPEDKDGYADEDGCPEADNDGDGLDDTADKCPDEAEDPDGHEDEDGCPDTDNDGDGVTDGFDSCPDEPEDMDGDRDEDGCPDNDSDRDGVPDDQDKCPDELEDTDGFGDEDGCPEVDFDGDGVADEEDECPEEAGPNNGCPAE